MALSMDEQRMLAEIERRLAAEDPGLATKLSSFRRAGSGAGSWSVRSRVIGTLCTMILLAVIALTVYAMMPFHAHSGNAPAGKSTVSTSAGASTGG